MNAQRNVLGGQVGTRGSPNIPAVAVTSTGGVTQATDQGKE